MEKRLLDHDPLTGITEWFHYDNGDVHIETVQDTDPILEANKTQQNDEDLTKQGMKEGMWRYASIPVVVQVRWLNEYGSKNWPLRPGNEKLLFSLLNKPEWRYLKTTQKIHCGR